MRFESFSEKQMRILTWWCDSSPDADRCAIICDGSVRSGKTVCLSVSFVLWSMQKFDGETFALCGQSVKVLRQNLVPALLDALRGTPYACTFKPSRGLLTVALGRRRNKYYLFGGGNEGSAALIQGITLAGVLFDEVALMAQSFVEQAVARCSVPGSRFWFSCNPRFPHHWFYREWIEGAEGKNALYLHLTMEDNPGIDPGIRERYTQLYAGMFYDRFVLGRWTVAEGAVYPMFSREKHVVAELPDTFERYLLSCDYGTVNPASFGLWGLCAGVWYRMREYYYRGGRGGVPRTDEEHADALEALAGGLPVDAAVVDPSAASFIEVLRRRQFQVVKASNDVVDGVRRVSAALSAGRLRFHASCTATFEEFEQYRWAEDETSEAPRKENDHAMDDIRYFVSFLSKGEGHGFVATSSIGRSAI